MSNKQWYNSRWATISFHVAAWLLWVSLPLIFRRDAEPGKSPNLDAIFNIPALVANGAWILLFYVNAYVLIPRLLNKRKSWQYLATLLVMYVGLVVVMSLVYHFFPYSGKMHGHDPAGDKEYQFVLSKLPFFLFFPFLVVWAISTVYRLLSDKIKTDQLLQEQVNENLKTELSFLRSQVSPHFLFNVLNNMVAMARLKSDKLEPSLIKLSGLMRYMLYDSDEQKVPLAGEIEYITNYIDLQRLRFGKELSINLDMDTREEYRLIEPMLLIPFIENAFKHGTGLIQKPEIDISLSVDRGVLYFNVKNKYNPDFGEVKDRTSGIGLTNVRRRLNLLYGKDHQLDIRQENGWHTVSLQLKLP